MRALAAVLFTGLLFAPAVWAEDDADHPHLMRQADGEMDEEKCTACHEDDMTLSASPLETCVSCHTEVPHSGAREHVTAEVDEVAELVSKDRNKDPELPLTEEGAIYCGTCHLYHDPALEEFSDQPLLASGHTPSGNPVEKDVREALVDRWSVLAKAHKQEKAGASMIEEGTRWLRLPVSDGKLCRHCHNYGTLK